MLDVANSPVDVHEFHLRKEILVDEYVNLNTSAAYSQAFRLHAFWTREKTFNDADVRRVLSEMTIGELESFMPSIFSNIFAESLAHGNIIRDEAVSLTEFVISKLQSETLIGGAAIPFPIKDPMVQLPCGSAILARKGNSNPEDSNSVSLIIYQIGLSADARIYVLSRLLAQLIGARCFDTLRTKEQLGYTVGCSYTVDNGVLNMYALVQSPSYGSAYLTERIDALFTALQNQINNMSLAELETFKDAVKVGLTEKPPTLSEVTGKYWSQISQHTYDFKQKNTRITELESVSLEDYRAFYNTNIISNHTRRRFVVEIEKCNILGCESLEISDGAPHVNISSGNGRDWKPLQRRFKSIIVDPANENKGQFHDNSTCRPPSQAPNQTSSPTPQNTKMSAGSTCSIFLAVSIISTSLLLCLIAL